jgi:lysophospholipid acyltransferase (LPLAT)-like uncharacterized protein
MKLISSKLIYLFLLLLRSTYRFEVQGVSNLEKARKNSPSASFIFAAWHQNILPLLLSHSKTSFSMIISSSKDGDILANVCSSFGHSPIRGSSSKGAIKSLVKGISNLREGLPLAITIDGPRGPLHDVKKGIFEIAKKSNTNIVPVCILSKSFWSINSAWDKFRFPKPFTKVIIHYCEPISVSIEKRKSDFDDLSNSLRTDLLSKEDEISQLFT